MGSNEPQIARGSPLQDVRNSVGFKRDDKPRPGGGAENKVGADTSSCAERMKKRRRDCDADMGGSRSKVSKYEDNYPPKEDNSQLEEDEMNIRENSGRTAKAVEETITASSSASDQSETNWKIDEHQAFVAAIFETGLMSCSPSVVMENMINLPPHITREITKSHLQKFRKAKDENREHFLKEYDEFFKAAEETKAATNSKGAVAPQEEAILFSVLGGRNSNELVGGDAAAIVSYSIINNCQHTPDPTKLPFQGVSASFPTLTETEKDSELGASLIYVKGLLSHMTEHLLTTRLCQHRRKKNNLSSSSLSKMAAKESTTRSGPNNPVRHYDTRSSSGGRQDEESDEDEAEDQRSRLVVSTGPQNQKAIASSVGSQGSSLNHRSMRQQPFNSTMQHGYCGYGPFPSSAGQVGPTLSRKTYLAPDSCSAYNSPGLIHPNLNNQQHHAHYLQHHISSDRKYDPRMYAANSKWHLSSLYTHAERGWYQKQPPSGAHPHHHQPYAHHNRSSMPLPPPPQRPPFRPLLQHPSYPPPRYNDDAPHLHNPYPSQDIDSGRVQSRVNEEVHQRSLARHNLALTFNFGGNLHLETPEDISPIGKSSDQGHLFDLIDKFWEEEPCSPVKSSRGRYFFSRADT